MSIDNVQDISARRQYVASAGQTVFVYPFPIFADADLVVVVNSTTKLLTTDYTVSGTGNATGGNATLLVACTGGEIVTLYRNMAIQRNSDFQQNGPFNSALFNDELDKLTLMVQQVKESVNRALRIPITANVIDTDISLDPSTWASKYLTFDANGKPTPALLSSTAMTQGTIGALLTPRTPLEIANGVVPTNTSYVAGRLERYGAVGDNVANDATAVSNAFLAGHVVHGTPGSTYYLGTGTITVSTGPVRANLYGVKFRTAVNGTVCLKVTTNDVVIMGLELYGRGNNPYVANEHLMEWSGADATHYKVGMALIDCYFHDVGSRAFYSIFGQKAYFRNPRFENIGYAGAHVLSGLDWLIEGGHIDGFGPGTSGNAYGISFTRDPTISDNLTISPRSKNCKVIGMTVKNNTLWAALDTHGGEEITFANNIIENCKHGVLIGSCPGVSGTALFGPKNSRSIGNQATGTGNGYGVAITGAGTVTGTTIDAAEGCSSIGDTVSNFGIPATTTQGGMEFYYTQGLNIVAPNVRNCLSNGIVLYHDNHGFVIAGGNITDPYDNTITDCAGIRLDAGYNDGVISGVSLQRVNAGLGTTVAARGIYEVVTTATSVKIGPNYNTFTLPYSGVPNFTITPLTDNSGGTPSSAIGATPGTYNQAYLANSLSTLLTAVNTIETALRNVGMAA